MSEVKGLFPRSNWDLVVRNPVTNALADVARKLSPGLREQLDSFRPYSADEHADLMARLETLKADLETPGKAEAASQEFRELYDLVQAHRPTSASRPSEWYESYLPQRSRHPEVDTFFGMMPEHLNELHADLKGFKAQFPADAKVENPDAFHEALHRFTWNGSKPEWIEPRMSIEHYDPEVVQAAHARVWSLIEDYGRMGPRPGRDFDQAKAVDQLRVRIGKEFRALEGAHSA